MVAKFVEVIVIGAGQCGLALGYHLKRSQVDFIILDGVETVGHSWRQRYDSLKIFTPNVMNTLPGLHSQISDGTFPSKDEIAEYLQTYAERFELPVRMSSRVEVLRPTADGYEVETATGTYHSRQVVVATGAFHTPNTPAFANNLAQEVYQVHTSAYRNPLQMPAEGPALVVGAGNSGGQIALELARDRKVYLSAGHPFYSSPQWLLESVWAWHVARWRSLRSRDYFGRQIALPWPFGNTQNFYVGSFWRQARKVNIELVPRVIHAAGEEVVLADGRRLCVRAVVWATGYKPDYSWIDAPIFDECGFPRLTKQARAMRGLYFLGLKRQRNPGSSFLMGVGEDSIYVAELLKSEATEFTAPNPR